MDPWASIRSLNLYEATLALVVLGCALSNALTHRQAFWRWRAAREAGEPGPTLFAWSQLRLESLILLAQALSLSMSIYRLSYPEVVGATVRTCISILLAVALTLNRRDFRRL